MSERTLPRLHSPCPGIPEDSQVGYEVDAGTPSRGPRSEAQDLGVPFHVHEAVAAHVEGDDLPFARFLAFHRLVDGAGDAVGALRAGRNPSAWTDCLARSNTYRSSSGYAIVSMK